MFTKLFRTLFSKNQHSPAKTSSQNVVHNVSAKPFYFDMVEYFCNGHDDTAVDVIIYDKNNNKLSAETFSWMTGCGEVTSEGIWRKADAYARTLIEEGIQMRNRKPI